MVHFLFFNCGIVEVKERLKRKICWKETHFFHLTPSKWVPSPDPLSFPPQKSVPSLASPRRRLAGASSWFWRHWRPAWTSSPQETSCPVSVQTWVCPNRCRWRPPSSPEKLWSSTWCLAGAPSQWLQQPSTWPPRPRQRRRPRKVSDCAVIILMIAKCCAEIRSCGPFFSHTLVVNFLTIDCIR